jgi:hypothetical protein
LFDLTGRIVQQERLTNAIAGAHSYLIDGSNLPTGMYILGLKGGQEIISRKLILLK